MACNVRKVREDELDQLLGLYRYLNSGDPDISGREETTNLWRSILNDKAQFLIVAEADGRLVASCTLVIVNNLTRGGSPYALIENVVTHEDYRKRGFGRAVLEKALETAKKHGCYKVMLMTGRKDEGILQFYEKVGFRRDIKTGFCIKF
jgi:GNAT superfamily N-acetyltransferase